jgi:hypothetical protein
LVKKALEFPSELNWGASEILPYRLMLSILRSSYIDNNLTCLLYLKATAAGAKGAQTLSVVHYNANIYIFVNVKYLRNNFAEAQIFASFVGS